MRSVANFLIKLIKERTSAVVLAAYILVSFWFYWDSYWSQIVYDRSQMGWTVAGEIRATEWGIENVLAKLKSGQNPFSRISNIMYPYGVDIVGADVGLAFLVAPLKIFFSTHQSLMLTTAIAMIIGGWGMYLLLAEMGVKKKWAAIMGLAFGNNTFLLPRMGHLGYLATFFLLPWFFYIGAKWIRSKKMSSKILWSILLATIYLMTLWTNFYYFVVLNLGLGVLCACWVWSNFIQIGHELKVSLVYIGIFLLTVGVLGSGWARTLFSTIKFSEVSDLSGWGGAIEFSADVINVFIPSEYNYYYGTLMAKIGRQIPLMGEIFEDYNYPGILIIVGMGIALVWSRKKNKKAINRKLWPYLVTTLFFLILTWGPFLQVAGEMYKELDDGIRVVVPLPFALLHYLPFFDNLRAPGRLAMGMIFFGTILVALVLNSIEKKRRNIWITLLPLLITGVVIFDQRPMSLRAEEMAEDYPESIYQVIRKDPDTSAVILLPFTIRDGMTWFGEYNAVDIDYAQSYFQKPIIGGYTGRIPDYIKEYYRSNPLVGQLGRIIDPTLAVNPYMLFIPERDKWINWDIEGAKKTIDLLGIKYVVSQNIRKLTCNRIWEAENFIQRLGYREVMQDGSTTLYEVNLMNDEYLNIRLGSKHDNIQLGMGWWGREDGFRWARKNSSVIMKTTNSGIYQLIVKVMSFQKPQIVTAYINEKIIGGALIDTKLVEVDLGSIELSPGIQVINIVWEGEVSPSEVQPGELDARKIAGKIQEIRLERTDQL